MIFDIEQLMGIRVKSATRQRVRPQMVAKLTQEGHSTRWCDRIVDQHCLRGDVREASAFEEHWTTTNMSIYSIAKFTNDSCLPSGMSRVLN